MPDVLTAPAPPPREAPPAGAEESPLRPPQGSVIPEGYLLTTRYLRHVYVDDDVSSCASTPHVHAEHTVFWSGRGIAGDLTVQGRQRSLSPGQGLFVPAGTDHAAERGPRTPVAALFIHPWAWPAAPRELGPVVVNAALREMLLHLAESGMPKEQRLRAQQVCLELITEEPVPSLSLPVPRDPRIAGIARAILRDPADDRSLEDWAYLASASTRTLVRAFRAETGMTFAHWRTCARMSAAIQLLGDGIAVGVVARRVGYSTTSAFSAAFHRTLGRPPHRFLPDPGAGR